MTLSKRRLFPAAGASGDPPWGGEHGQFGGDRHFGRGRRFVPGLGYGFYDYGCSYGYPYYKSFQKTMVADIARELHMSPANVYRFFAAKSEINKAVCLDILSRIEAEAEKIALTRGTAAQRMRNLIGSVEKTHSKLCMSDRKLHELIAAAITDNWTIMRKHN